MDNSYINPQEVSQAEIVISIPTQNDECDLVGTTLAVNSGLLEFFRSQKSVIINCDCSSNAGTKETFLGLETEIPRIYIGMGDSQKKGRVLQNSLQRALDLDARILLIIEPNITNIQPVWIKKLVEPLEKNFQFVAPLYVHHKGENLLNNLLTYPLTRSLYGWRIKRPVGEELGFRRDLIEKIFQKGVLNPYIESDGFNLYLSSIAMCFRVPMCQSIIGHPRRNVVNANDMSNSYFCNVVGTAFSLMAPLERYWKRIKWSKPTAILGLDTDEIESAEEVEIDTENLHERFLGGFRKFEEFWRNTISQNTFNKLQEIRNLGMDHFSFPAQTWTSVVYDFALAFRRRQDKDQQEHLLEALLPLYYGKALSYVKRTERMSVQQADDCIEVECMVFEENKPYLVSKWNEFT